MKKYKNLIILGSIFALLLLLVILKSIKGYDKGFEKPDYIKMDKDSIQSITFKNDKGDFLFIRKESGDWMMEKPEEYKADKNSINQLLNIAADFKLSDIISKDKRKYKFYHVDSTNGLRLTFKNNKKKEFSILLGKQNSNYTHTFVRVGDNPFIYQIKGNFNNRLNKDIDDWKDKTIFDLSSNDVTSFILTQGKRKSIITKKEVEKKVKDDKNKDENAKKEEGFEKKKTTEIIWESDKGIKLNKSKVENFIRDLCKLKTAKFSKTKPTTKYAIKITINTLSGKEELTIWKKDKNNMIPVMKSGSNIVFLLREYSGKKFIKKVEDFK